MKVISILGLALRRLRRRPVRSLLLLQGTVWGVAVAIFPTAVIQGTREAALTQSRRLGADRISVAADPTSARSTVIERDDLVFLRSAVEREDIAVTALGGVAVLEQRFQPGAGSDDTPLTVLACSPQTPQARGLELAAGRWLETRDGADRCVVEAGVGAWLGRPGLTAGDRLNVPGRSEPLEVVGVMRARDATALRTDDLGFDLSHPLYKSVAQQFLLAMGIPVIANDGWKRTDTCLYVPAAEGTEMEWVFLRVPPGRISDAAKAIRDAMVEREKTVLTLYPLVLPVVMGDEVERFNAVNVAMFLACLFMGAVVMANLGLLNVLSRAREIAIRRVEGATRRDIGWHFLVEGLLLSAVGCILGCALGMGLAALRVSLEPVTGFAWSFPYVEASIATAAAMTIGLLAALLPALRASTQEPVRGLADD